MALLWKLILVGLDLVSFVPGPVGWVGVGGRLGASYIDPYESQGLTAPAQIPSHLMRDANNLGNTLNSAYEATMGTTNVVSKVFNPVANQANAITKLGNKASAFGNAAKGSVRAAGAVGRGVLGTVGYGLNIYQTYQDIKSIFEEEDY